MGNGGYASYDQTFLYTGRIRRGPLTGRWKVYWMCKTALMSWVGDNFHVWVVKGQPRSGFDTQEEAEAFERQVKESGRTPQADGFNLDGGTHASILEGA